VKAHRNRLLWASWPWTRPKDKQRPGRWRYLADSRQRSVTERTHTWVVPARIEANDLGNLYSKASGSAKCLSGHADSIPLQG